MRPTRKIQNGYIYSKIVHTRRWLKVQSEGLSKKCPKLFDHTRVRLSIYDKSHRVKVQTTRLIIVAWFLNVKISPYSYLQVGLWLAYIYDWFTGLLVHRKFCSFLQRRRWEVPFLSIVASALSSYNTPRARVGLPPTLSSFFFLSRQTFMIFPISLLLL